MKKLLTIIFFLLSISVEARNFYFSTSTGNDLRTSAESQSPNTPWKTTAKLNSFFSSLLPGDSVLFKRGEIFVGTIIVSRSGTSLLPIIISAYGTGEQPIITSLVSITGWTLTGPNIWTSAVNASLGATVNIVLQNGVAKPLGRYPNLSATNKGYLKFEASTSLSITDNELPLTTNWVGAEICVRVQQYETNVRTITAQANTKLTVSAAFSRTAIPGMGYFFQDDPKTLDQQGEWYYNPTTKQISMYSVGMPSGTIQATSLNSLVTSTTFSWVTLDGLNLKGANDKAVDFGVCAACGLGGGNNAVKNSTIIFNIVGINTSQHLNPKILNNSITYSFGQAINISNGDNLDFGNNYIQYSGHVQGMGSSIVAPYGIFAKGEAGHIYNNVFKNIGYTGISFDGDDFITEYNYIDSFCLVINDGAGIYHRPSANKRTGQIARYNIISNSGDARAGGLNPTLFQAEGAYFDANSKDLQLIGNSISNCGSNAIFINFNDSNIVITGNTGYNNLYGIYVHSRKGGRTRNITIRNNIFFAKTVSQFPAFYSSDSAEIHLLGQFDSNYYCRPIKEPQGIANSGTPTSGGTIIAKRGTTGYYSLDKWKTYQGAYDQNSRISPKGFDTLRYEANTSYRDSVVNLNYGLRDYTWLTATGARVKGTLTLAPYTSVILIRDTIVPIVVIPNVPPTVSITSPANGTSYVAPGTVNITAVAADTDGTITRVDFYSGATLIGTDNSSPYTITWNSVPSGGYSLTARAFDNAGDSATSAAIAISVIAVNTPPVVSITSPANNSNYSTPAAFTTEVDATDANDSVEVVNFYEDNIWIGNDSVRPFVFDVAGRVTGTYNYFAVAKDYEGDSTTSAGITIVVGPPPPLAANANVGTILCNGGSTIITISATGGTAPYTGTGSNVVGAGDYTYIVEDFDGTKDTIVVTVSQPAVLSLTDSIGAIGTYGGTTEAHIFPTGGTPNYEYQINNGQWQSSNIFVIQAGGYLVNVRDSNGCTDNIFFSVTQPTSTGNMSIRREGKHINVNR